MNTLDSAKSYESNPTDMLAQSSQEWEGLVQQRGPYQVALRTIGVHLDEHGAHHANIMELVDGFSVRYQRSLIDDDLVSEHFAYTDVISLANEVERKRKRKLFGGKREEGRYENTLRALGYELDGAQAYSLLIDEVDEGFLVTYQYLKPSQGFMVRKRMVFLEIDSIHRVLDDARERRSEGKRGLMTLLAG